MKKKQRNPHPNTGCHSTTWEDRFFFSFFYLSLGIYNRYNQQNKPYRILTNLHPIYKQEPTEYDKDDIDTQQEQAS